MVMLFLSKWALRRQQSRVTSVFVTHDERALRHRNLFHVKLSSASDTAKEGSWLPNTRAATANQNVTINVRREKLEEGRYWCLPHKLKPSKTESERQLGSDLNPQNESRRGVIDDKKYQIQLFKC